MLPCHSTLCHKVVNIDQVVTDPFDQDMGKCKKENVKKIMQSTVLSNKNFNLQYRIKKQRKSFLLQSRRKKICSPPKASISKNQYQQCKRGKSLCDV